jgi:hypothetical protein
VTPALVVYIGSFLYSLTYNKNTLGMTHFPMDDSYQGRSIELPTMEGQLPISWEHEKLHACMHNHEHHFKTKEAFEAHLRMQTYTEEELVTILAPCMLALEKVDLRQNSLRKRK